MSRGVAAVLAHCPAKINLALRVLARRDDGYHELDTVFQAIDLWDTLELWPAEELVLHVEAGQPTGADNLVFRAATLLRERHAAGSPGAEMRLCKRIPMQGGLGGGSSDAAAALVACARLWRLSMGEMELAELGAELGADVPFFLRGGTARGRGRGDRIEPLPPFRGGAVVLGTPPFGLSTAEVFSQVESVLTLPGKGVNLPVSARLKWPEDNDFGFMVNDLEHVVFDLRPELRRFRDALLEQGAEAALLSGSGSSLFGLFSDPERARDGCRRLGGMFEEWSLQATRTVDAGIQLQEPDSRVG